MGNLLKKYISGDSITIGFLFDESYDKTRIQSICAFVSGIQMPPLSVNGEFYRLELSSDFTQQLSGKSDILLWLDDSQIGVKKLDVGYLLFTDANDNKSNQSVNLGYDIEITLTVDESLTTQCVALIEAIKGENGIVDSDTLDSAITDDYSLETTIETTDIIVGQGKKKWSLQTIYAKVKSLLGISSEGSEIKYLNEKGNFTEPITVDQLTLSQQEQCKIVLSGQDADIDPSYIINDPIWSDFNLFKSNMNLTVSTAPADLDIIIDMKKNGTSIFVNKMKIPAGSLVNDNTFTLTANPIVFSAGDKRTISFIQVGSGETGKNLIYSEIQNKI